WSVGLVCTLYLTSVFMFHPEYVFDIYPVLADTYMKATWYWRPMEFAGAYLIALLVLLRLRPNLPLSPLVVVLLSASLAAVVPLVYQGKGWPYHAYPAISLLLMALLCRFAQCSTAGREAYGNGAA